MTGYLVVVGSGLMQQPVYQEARKLGIPTLGLDRDPNSAASLLADLWYECDISDEEACLAVLRRHKGPFLGVLTVGTDFSTTVARIAEEFGLRSHSYRAALAAKDKALMRQKLAQAGIEVPRFCTWDESTTDLGGVSFPLVVKPVDNMGARGVQRVDTPLQLQQAVQSAKKHSRQGRVILEDFIEGPEYSLDALITPNGFFRRGLADRDIHFPPFFVELGHSFPSEAAPEVQEELWRCLEDSARGLGLEWGGVKGDLKWHDGRPVAGEVAGRLSGGFMSGWTFPLASGVHPVQEAILLALGQQPQNPEYSLNQAVAEGALIGLPGVLNGWVHLSSHRELRGLQEMFFLKEPGQEVIFPTSNVEKIANIIVSAADLEQARSRLMEARRRLVPRLQAHHPATENWLSRPSQPAFRNGRDWYGVLWEDRVQDLRNVNPELWKKLSQVHQKRVIESLEAGGMTGAVYRLDCLALDLS